MDWTGFDQSQKITDVMNTDMSKIKNGDVLAMVDKDGDTIHSAVWDESAGKFSTKNGIGEDTKMMTLGELQQVYPSSTSQGFITPVDSAKRMVNVDVNPGKKSGTAYLKDEQQLKNEIQKKN